MRPTIALLTDFGTQDAYVGVMKAVMTTLAPDAQFIDITHAIRPQNVRQAALMLLNNYAYFPSETIFLCVVDPGVGGARKPIAVQAGDYRFVAPDNGLLSYVLNEIGNPHIVELNAREYRLPQTSYTFHGRDIFAPAAAHLANGITIEALGSRLERVAQQMAPTLRINSHQINGNVLYADHFGNIITSISQVNWATPDEVHLIPRFGKRDQTYILPAAETLVSLKDQTLKGIRHSYSESRKDELIALIDSNGYLEIACNQGNAAHRLAINGGETVTIKIG